MKGLPRYSMSNEDMGIKISSDKIFLSNIHSHTYYELLLYEPFDGESIINGRVNKINEMSAVLITPSDLHKTVVMPGCKSRFIKIAFNPDCITSAKLPSSAVIYKITDENRFSLSVFEEIYAKRENVPYAKILLNTLLHALESGEVKTVISQKNKHAIVAEAIQIIDSSFASQITLESVAAQLSISSQYLSKIFPELTNMNFRDYLTSRRLDYALVLLQNPELSMTDISQACGFNDLSYFTKKFKARYNIAPGKYNKYIQYE